MTYIYRVQDRDGRGPWKPGFSQKWVRYRPDHEVLLPVYIEMPSAPDKRHPGFHVGVGCISLDQLRRWFREDEYRTLMDYGYRCVRHVGSFLGESETQCVFERHRPLSDHNGFVSLYGEEVYDVQPQERWIRLCQK